MGQGQAEVALATLKAAAKSGSWVCLKNLHLATSWLPTLEKELVTLNPHENFRLWLTTEPHPKFSAILLQTSLKITYEAPPGIKKNLMRTFDSWTPDYLSNGPAQRAQSLFMLAWFHALIQERRKYIPQAWTKFYEFSFADLRAAAEVIENVTRGKQIDWAMIQGLLELAIYGGRVDNDFDIRVLQVYLAQYFNYDIIASKTPKKLARNLTLPSTAKYDDYMEVINGLPDYDNPELFGLPANIERSVQRANSASIIAQLKILEVSVSEGTRFNREQWSVQLSPIVQLWQKLTTNNDVLKADTQKRFESENPIDIFVLMEYDNSKNLVQRVNTSLGFITKVISGSMLLSPAIQAVGTSLLRGQVPTEWSDQWEGPDNPYAWLRQLISRSMALEGWKQRSESGTLLNEPIMLSELFRPDTLLNALRQQTARATKRPIDGLKLVASWDPRLLSSLKIPLSIQVDGLLLQGCNFDGDKLFDAYADAPELVAIPKCTLAWIGRDEKDPYPEEGSVLVPLYLETDRTRPTTHSKSTNPNALMKKPPTPLRYAGVAARYATTAREKLVSQLHMPCIVGDKMKWVQAGVALCLSEH